jgi:hypothetical protein
MTDSVIAALIAGTATLSASFLQFRSAALRDRGQPGAAARRKLRWQRILLLVLVTASAASGFAISQWLTNGERVASAELQKELQSRIAEVTHTAGELEATRAAERSEIETGVLRRIGTDGVTVAATVPPCHASAATATPATAGATSAASAPAADPPTAGGPAASAPCTEAEAVPVTLCATIPASATVTEVALFSRPADADTPWNTSRFLPGQAAAEARFAEKYSESTPESGSRQVCQVFAHWSAEHARAVRVLVRYTL